MNDYLANGFAKKVSNVDLSDKECGIWYLPHHAVLHPHKPGKVRMVFDCAANFKGISLNTMLIRGPDLMNSLTGVLMRFRTEPVALNGDIEKMYHQVRADPRHCDALRFLWWPNGNLNTALETYQMLVHVFGAASSLTCSNFCLGQVAKDFGHLFPTSATTIVNNNFYKDDCLVSFSSAKKVIQMRQVLSNLLAKGGFRLTKWATITQEVLDSIPDSEKAKNVISHSITDAETRVLGIRWIVTEDYFYFTINLPNITST